MTYLKKHKKDISIHICWWLVYITYEVAVSAVVTHRFSHFAYYFFFYLLNISLFYLHALWVLPTAIKSPLTTIWRLPLLLILEIAGYIAFSVLISLMLQHFKLRSNPLVLDLKLYTGICWRGMLFLLYGTGYYFIIRYIRKTRVVHERALELKQLKLELLMIENDFLRSQINPHLLFNTLNFIKYSAKNQPDIADEAIIRLSELMSFALERNNRDEIHIVEEISQVENMIVLNQLRFDNKLNISCAFNVHDPSVKFIPVVLLTLTENIFKHGDLTDPEAGAELIVSTNDKGIFISTKNLTGGNYKKEGKKSGLDNIASRLMITYPGNHHFTYGFHNGYFTTRLIVNFNMPVTE